MKCKHCLNQIRLLKTRKSLIPADESIKVEKKKKL